MHGKGHEDEDDDDDYEEEAAKVKRIPGVK